jgi:hypothetical protein
VKGTQSEIIPSKANEDTGKKPVWKPSSEDRAASLSTCVQRKAAFWNATKWQEKRHLQMGGCLSSQN